MRWMILAARVAAVRGGAEREDVRTGRLGCQEPEPETGRYNRRVSHRLLPATVALAGLVALGALSARAQKGATAPDAAQPAPSAPQNQPATPGDLPPTPENPPPPGDPTGDPPSEPPGTESADPGPAQPVDSDEPWALPADLLASLSRQADVYRDYALRFTCTENARVAHYDESNEASREAQRRYAYLLERDKAGGLREYREVIKTRQKGSESVPTGTAADD
jgi:hypothetical protein